MSTSEMKLCPYCGEEIRAVAIRCKHCHATLEGSVRPSPDQKASAPTHQGSLAPGAFVREYQVVRLLGEGGMGEVYLAEHSYTGQQVALKAVLPGLMVDQTQRRRFVEEGRVMAGLKHPNVVALYNFFEEDGRFFLAMEYVKGGTLEARLEHFSVAEQKMPFPELLSITADILKGLAAAHAQAMPIVHRDLKPANILIDSAGRAVISDFGIAKALGREKMTKTRGLVGTFEYMSPEQVMGVEVTPASDIYSLGVIIYQMICGKVPFPQKSDTGLEVLDAHRHTAPPSLLKVRCECPPRLAGCVERALAKLPSDRYADASSMLQAIEQVRISEEAAPVQSGALTKRRRLHWARLALLVMIIAGSILVLLGYQTGGSESQQGRISSAEQPKPANKAWPTQPDGQGLPSSGPNENGTPTQEAHGSERHKSVDSDGSDGTDSSVRPSPQERGAGGSSGLVDGKGTSGNGSPWPARTPDSRTSPPATPQVEEVWDDISGVFPGGRKVVPAATPGELDYNRPACEESSFKGKDLEAFKAMTESLGKAESLSNGSDPAPHLVQPAVAAARDAAKASAIVWDACRARLETGVGLCKAERLEASRRRGSNCRQPCQEAKRAVCEPKGNNRDCALDFCRLTYEEVKQALGDCSTDKACEAFRSFAPKPTGTQTPKQDSPLPSATTNSPAATTTK